MKVDIIPIILAKRIEGKELLTRKVADKESPRTAGK